MVDGGMAEKPIAAFFKIATGANTTSQGFESPSLRRHPDNLIQ